MCRCCFSHLHLRSGLAHRAERCWLLAGLRWHIVKDHSEGTLRWGLCCHYLLNRSLLSCFENVLPILLRRPGAWVPLTHSPSMLKRKPSLHSKSVPGQPSSQSSQVFLTTSPVSSTWSKMIKDKISSRVHFKGLQQCCLKCRHQISPQLHTKQRHFQIQRWCTCCRSLPVRDGQEMCFDLVD